MDNEKMNCPMCASEAHPDELVLYESFKGNKIGKVWHFYCDFCGHTWAVQKNN